MASTILWCSRGAAAAALLVVLLMLGVVQSTHAARDNSIFKDHVLSAEAAEAMMPALQDVVQAVEAAGRKLLQSTAPAPSTTTNVTQLKLEAKNTLLVSDVFGLVYTGGNFARSIFALLMPIVVAGQTGTIAVDANYLLNLSQLMAQFVATLGDLLSKGARLTADGIAPV